MRPMRWLDALAPELEYRGLVGHRRALLRRVPAEWRERLPADTWSRLCAASGVRVAFRTDSPTIAVRAEWLSRQTDRANGEIDLYQNGEFYGQLRCLGLGTAEGVIYDGPARDRCVELYMPPYAEIRLAGVGVDEGRIRTAAAADQWSAAAVLRRLHHPRQQYHAGGHDLSGADRPPPGGGLCEPGRRRLGPR